MAKKPREISQRILEPKQTIEAITRIRETGLIKWSFTFSHSLTIENLTELGNLLNKIEREYIADKLLMDPKELEFDILRHLNDYQDIGISSPMNNKSAREILRDGFIYAYGYVKEFNFSNPTIIEFSTNESPGLVREIPKGKYELSVKKLQDDWFIQGRVKLYGKGYLETIKKCYSKLIKVLEDI